MILDGAERQDMAKGWAAPARGRSLIDKIIYPQQASREDETLQRGLYQGCATAPSASVCVYLSATGAGCRRALVIGVRAVSWGGMTSRFVWWGWFRLARILFAHTPEYRRISARGSARRRPRTSNWPTAELSR